MRAELAAEFAGRSEIIQIRIGAFGSFSDNLKSNNVIVSGAKCNACETEDLDLLFSWIQTYILLCV